ncbi:CsbD family protein [Enteractinococcus coprophilus]|uniref:CsbD-like protein n=1 Tax=Enteractinococcus coprophilus TaxID=1027633 RepID=A0A543ANL5_9MICC|nr:CsbD family protein [Enteractinococcus coprophilus]TQL74170.1 CsbD-like protein [Enteractinococcus coprophilus]
MGFDEKADAMKDKVTGKVKEGAGKVTGDAKTEGEGKSQQLQGKVKEGVTDAKDKAKGFTEGFKKD